MSDRQKHELLMTNPGSTVEFKEPKGKFKGILKDLKNGIDLLKHDLGMHNSHHWAFMSDRQKGLVKAVKKYFKIYEHRLMMEILMM
ncbi:conserved hypothetical protein, partial [Ricinus communis]